MHKDVFIEYLEELESFSYDIKLDLAANKPDKAYSKLIALNFNLAELILKLSR